MSTLDILLASGASLTVTRFEGNRGLPAVWFVEDEHGPVETFSTEEEARAALRGERTAAEPLVVFA